MSKPKVGDRILNTTGIRPQINVVDHITGETVWFKDRKGDSVGYFTDNGPYELRRRADGVWYCDHSRRSPSATKEK